ncbi:MAG: molybdopterin molybdotransferase MoeA [Firmicutes bacterium]|nr:molybdopterin molybdotransferase MoeA [Bacillota bacterium]
MDAAVVFTPRAVLGKVASNMMEGIELEKARQLIEERAIPPGPETVALPEALGRVLAEDIHSPMDQPSFNRSPLDGYALRAKDTEGAAPRTPVRLEIIDAIHAGIYSRKEVTPGTAVRLMTGSPIPEGADCVVRQEDTRADAAGRQVEVLKQLRPWDNYCFQGESFKKGATVLSKNTLLGAAEIGVLASLGFSTLTVYCRPVAAVISTGDELVEPGLDLTTGKVYDSNFYTIACRLRECGVEVLPGISVGDDRHLIADTIADMIDKVDFIVSTGGVSVGEKDYMMGVMETLGAEKIFWKVNIKPGSPALFTVLKGKPVISLSGNPLAASVTLDLLLLPFLKSITHNHALKLKSMRAVLQNDFKKSSPIRRLLRGQFMHRENGEAVVTIIEAEQSPGSLKSVLGSNCYIDIEKGSPGLKRGEQVKIIITA